MDNRLLLTKAITLLYRESLVQDKTENSIDLVRTTLENVKAPEVVVGINPERDIIMSLKRTLLEMCESPELDFVKEDLLQSIRSNCGDDLTLYTNIEQSINTEMSDGALKRSIINIRKNLINHFKEEEISKILNKAAWDFRFQREKIKSVPNYLSQMVTQLEPYQIVSSKKDPAINEQVSFEDSEGVENIFATVQNDGSGKGVIRFGWQALNNALDGGIRPGEYAFLMALQHNWKSGFSLSLFKQIPIYNKPHLIKKDKKPLIIRISFEDFLKSNFQFLYKSLKENESGEVYRDEFRDGPIDPDTQEPTKIPVISPKDKSTYVIEKLKVNGWHIDMLYVNPIEWSYRDLCNYIIEKEAEGYEVKLCMVDYLQKVPTVGCEQGPMGHDLRNMNERIKAFMAPRGIIFITPWQLSPEAKMLRRDGHPNFVTKLVGNGYTNGCKTLDQVYDIGLIFHLEHVNKEWYLDVALDKLRRIDQPDDKYRHFALKFNNTKAGKGTILEDIGKENSAYKKPGGNKFTSEAEEQTYWDF